MLQRKNPTKLGCDFLLTDNENACGDVGEFQIRSGRQNITRPDDLVVTCDGQAATQVTAKTDSEALGVRISTRRRVTAAGRFNLAAWARTYIPITFTFDMNVRTPGIKTQSVIYTVNIL